MNILLEKSLDILTESRHRSREEDRDIIIVLEDSDSPMRNVYINKLYDSILDKKHIDFDDIPQSKGSIQTYAGYTTIKEVLGLILNLAKEEKSITVEKAVRTVNEAIDNMTALSAIYQKGYMIKNEYVMLDYNIYVYAIVQATSAILYEFVDYVKRPDSQSFEIKLKNTKYRANLFYVEQLEAFNSINKANKYDKYLQSVITNGAKNFTGFEALGLGVMISIALAIVPISRELVYRYYVGNAKLSDMLAQQAHLLELNKSVVEANTNFKPDQRKKILIKQEKMKNLFLRLSEKLRVEDIKAGDNSKQNLQKDNKLLTLDNIKREVNNEEITLL